MRFLVDAQLPPALARWLSARGHPSDHVADLGMDAAADRVIWQWAERERAGIVTKDEDFAVSRIAHDSDTPQVVDSLERGESLIEIR
jgi:predicted nuclease of predicted toxin-antitoxin system